MIWTPVVAALFALTLAGFAVVFRIQLAGFAISRWCDGRGLVCDGEVSSVSMRRVVLSDVRVASGGATPFEAERIGVALAWPSLIRPRAARIEAASPVLRARFDGERFTAYGLEQALPSGGGDGRLPEFDISNALLVVDTPAGEARGTAWAAGSFPDAFDAVVEIAPVFLERGGDRLRIEEARAEVSNGPDGLKADLAVDLPEARFQAASADDLRLGLSVSDSETGWRALFEAKGRALALGETALEAGDASGVAVFSQAPGAPSALLSVVNALAVDAELSGVSSGALSIRSLELEASVNRDRSAVLTGPLIAKAEGVNNPLGRARSLRFDGVVNAGARALDGLLEAEGAALESPLISALVERIDAPAPLDRHAAELKSLANTAASNFDARARLALEAPEAGGWRFEARDGLKAEGANGLSIVVSAEGGWLDGGSGAQSARGDVALRAGDGLSIAAKDVALARREERFELQTGAITLEPWRVDGLAVGADLEKTAFSTVRGGFEAGGDGAVTVDGRLFGAGVDALVVSGAVAASQTGEGLRVTSTCLDAEADGLAAGAVGLGAVAARLCPMGGVLVSPSSGAPSGRLKADRLETRVRAGHFSGPVALEGADVEWRAAERFSAHLASDGLQASLTSDGKSLLLSAGDLAAGARFGRSGAAYDLAIADAEARGDFLPAQTDIAWLRFDLETLSDGLSGGGAASGVRLSDQRADPLYEPLVSDLDARVAGGRLNVSGPVRLEKSGATLADVSLDLDLASVTGEARVEGRRLDFAPGGLQPAQISDRLRGLFTNARGALETRAQFSIKGGDVSGRGTAAVSDFSLQTQALGRVERVNGTLLFDDLIALTTAPGQTVTVGEINPGVKLSNGRLQFQLLGPGEARLETAVWPFAGGFLKVEPTVWRLNERERKVTVSADAVELSELVEVLAARNLEADGEISGAFPIVFEGADVYIRKARFSALGDGGVIKYTGQAARQAAGTNESVALAFDALENLEYTVLEIGADGNLAGDVTVTLKIVGKNPAVLSGAPFAFNVSVDSELGRLIQSGRSMATSDWLADAVAEQIADDAERNADEPPR